jgi:hypothetical protein
LLSTLFREPVAGADLNPGGTGLAGGVDLGGLQFLSRLSKTPGGVESAYWAVGAIEFLERSDDPLDRTFGGHDDSVSTKPSGQ